MAQPNLKLADDTTRKPVHRFNFTKAALEAVPPPERGRKFVYDTRRSGLALAITSTGHRAFYLYRKTRKGEVVKMQIGNYADTTIANARDEVDKLSVDIANGRNPAEARRAQRQEQARTQTVKGAWEKYRDDHLKPHCAASTLQNDGYLYEALPFKTRKLGTVTTDDIKRMHEATCKRGKVAMANKVVLFVRRLYNYASDELNYTGDNPVRIRQGRRRRRGSGGKTDGAAVSLAAEQSRSRYLKASEAPAFFKALAAEDDADLQHLIYLLIYTGARRGNLQAMRWDHIDFTAGVWSIPANEAKAKAEIHIPLIRKAVAILRLRRKWNNQRENPSVYVFPASRGKTGHMMEPKKKWWEFRKRAGVPDLTLHDLRRTLGTWQRTSGTEMATIGASLGHRSLVSTQVYARADVEPVRASVDRATAALLAAGKPAKKQTTKNG